MRLICLKINIAIARMLFCKCGNHLNEFSILYQQGALETYIINTENGTWKLGSGISGKL